MHGLKSLVRYYVGVLVTREEGGRGVGANNSLIKSEFVIVCNFRCGLDRAIFWDVELNGGMP